MVVDEEISVIEKIKSCLKKENIDVVTVDSNRKAFEILDNDKENNFNLILINTHLPDSNVSAFFSMKPKSNKDIDTTTEENFLIKPFTNEKLLEFIKRKI